MSPWLAGVVALSAEVATPREVEVRLDRRVMAVSIVAWLAHEDDDWLATLPAYRAALRAHFGPFRDHRAVQLAGQLARAGFTYDAPVGFALHLDEQTLAPRTPLPPYYLERAGSLERLEEFRQELSRFVTDADLDGFLTAMAPLHQRELTRVKRALDPRAIDALDALYGGGGDARYALLVAPALGPHHHGISVETSTGVERYQVSNTLRFATDTPLQLALDDLVLHEFAHPLAKPVMAVVEAPLAKLGPALMPPIEAAMKEQAYTTWTLVFEEHLVRATTCRLLQRRHGEETGRMCLAGEVARGFRYVVPLYEALGDYLDRRDRYADLSRYGRQLVRALEPAARDPEGWWTASGWAPPPLPESVATVVLPTDDGATPELQQAARQLAIRRFGGRLITDREAMDEPGNSYVVVGGPAANRLAARFVPGWPLRIEDDALQIGGTRFEGRALGAAVTVPGPAGPWVVLLGTDPEVTAQPTGFPRPGGWTVWTRRGDCGAGQLPPVAGLPATPRVFQCDPEPAQRPWVPDPLGQPLRWTGRVPPELTPARFEATLTDALASCPLDAELVGLACDEPPCIALFRARELEPEKRLVACEPWEVPLGQTVHLVRAAVPCPEGHDERAVLISPAPAALQRALGEQALADRLPWRWMRALGGWSCAPDRSSSDADLR